MLKETINQDIKTAMRAGDKVKAEVLKNLKSAILYEEVAQKVRDVGLSDEQVQTVLAREAKKRAESAELYQKAEADERAASELHEKEIIEAYLPKQLSDAELQKIVDDVFAANPNAQMGPAIGMVRAKVGSAADGGRIAATVKAKLQG